MMDGMNTSLQRRLDGVDLYLWLRLVLTLVLLAGTAAVVAALT